jgi:hypothetical protein
MPCSITSATDPLRYAIVGVPEAIASIITRPKGSGQSIGNKSASALPRKAGLYHALGAAVQARWDSFDKGCNLRNLHAPVLHQKINANGTE